ncbi:hypothetical protein H1D32_21545 [Anaerobacillus sp. CMMVII]|uniref:hypothetical protein n=1 Tax=Anaerobacillus sp. CMMVII TaxID=2755588 RepID=UPI0021B835A6|nr:hypothetical protein [Anaerobacillus sp. CMMVII]MCT8140044.1 hypothetical protein [Anaerobacillus sp. CMMVII]
MNYNYSNIGVPVFFTTRDNNNQDTTKLFEDRYEVFVEGKYVGEKTLYAQNEDFHDVGDFLERQGFQNVEVELNGDHIIVHADNGEEASRMRQALEVYLKNR